MGHGRGPIAVAYFAARQCATMAEDGAVPVAKVAEAIAKYGINADKVNPLYA